MAQDSSDVIGSGSFQSTATITINLININDEYPQFLNAPYEVMIMEHSDNGSVVVMVIMCMIELLILYCNHSSMSLIGILVLVVLLKLALPTMKMSLK